MDFWKLNSQSCICPQRAPVSLVNDDSPSRKAAVKTHPVPRLGAQDIPAALEPDLKGADAKILLRCTVTSEVYDADGSLRLALPGGGRTAVVTESMSSRLMTAQQVLSVGCLSSTSLRRL